MPNYVVAKIEQPSLDSEQITKYFRYFNGSSSEPLKAEYYQNQDGAFHFMKENEADYVAKLVGGQVLLQG